MPARKASQTATDTCDILIIGAGASGGAAAWLLAKNGFNVVVLEQGPWVKPDDFVTDRKDFEVAIRDEWNFNPNVRKSRQDYPVNDAASPIKPLMFNAVGGSTVHWTAHAPRFHPSDFRVKSLDGVADDWPITYWDLEPYYDLNDRMMGCAGIAGDPANPSQTPRPMPPVPLGNDTKAVIKGFEKLGWHWWPSDNYVNSIPYAGHAACNNCGVNGFGCRLGAKGSSDLRYFPEAIRMGADVRPWSRVYEVTTGSDGRATGARYFDKAGEKQFQPARAVIVAGNGIGTPRLLLLSKSAKHPYGLANSSGLVGKRFMFHPYSSAGGFFNEDLKSYQGTGANIIWSQEFYETDRSRGFVRGYTFQIGRGTAPITTAMGLARGSPFASTAPRAAWGPQHHVDFRERFGRSMGMAAICEDLPEEHNRVELDPHLTDSDGIPAPRVSYTLSENSKRMLAHGAMMAAKVLKAAGAHKVTVTPLIVQGGWHLMGTARMGDDAKASVVDRSGQAHDADNLFIVDGSVFVTSAGVNPTPTIQAIALWAADYIARERGDLKRSGR
jgi:choline dehydrogenase-like flavoprotein